MNTQYYTVSEVATLLNVSARTVSRMIKNGELPANRVGGAVRIAPADLSVYLNASKIEPTKKKTTLEKPRRLRTEAGSSDVFPR